MADPSTVRLAPAGLAHRAGASFFIVARHSATRSTGRGKGGYPERLVSSAGNLAIATTPTFIRSPADFAANVALGTTSETLVLEFKQSIDWKAAGAKAKQDAQKELCRDLGQFANTWGGVLLVGIAEHTDPLTGARVASRVVPVTDIAGLTQWIEQAITNFLVPSTISHDIVPISTASGSIVAVNVLASVHLVAVWDRQAHTIEYPYRTNHGKDWMNPDEAEAHMMSGSRATRLVVEQAVAKTGSGRIEIVGPICAVGSGGVDEGARLNSNEPPALVAVREHHIEIRFHVHSSYQTLTVPLACVRSAWSEEGRTMLLLDGVRIVSRLSRLELLPF